MATEKSSNPRRPLSAAQLVVVCTLLNMLLFHLPLYEYAINNISLSSINGILTFVTLVLVVSVFTAVLLALIAIISPRLVKLFFLVATLLNATALYFLVTYEIIFDKSMMANIFNTRSEESLDFMHPKLFLYILILGVLPAWLIGKIPVQPVKRLRLFCQMSLAVLVSLVFIYLNAPTWLWFDKHGKTLGGKILPWSYIINTARYKNEANRRNGDVILLPDATVVDDNRVVVFLVIGETARSQNFSLYGYERQTNPHLENLDVAVLKGAKSCSTYTVASLHCMLSHTGKTSGSYEPLPSYLQRSGINVIWRTNNWGEPPITVSKYQKAGELRKNCSGDYCQFDDVLLSNLESQISRSTAKKQLITLHTKGSHGPSYYLRYPLQFDVFKPVCRSVELNKCSDQSLLNAYDNTILYTDDLLKRTIELLRKIDNIPSVMIYVSDHGESLGEFGVYLHGTPYSIAPDVQKEIPFLVWMSDDFQSSKGITPSDLEQAKSHTHSQIFHSIMGALGIQSEVYNKKLDIFSQSK